MAQHSLTNLRSIIGGAVTVALFLAAVLFIVSWGLPR